MTIERRGHTRTNLHVPLVLLPVGSSALIRTETENVSIDGFFCYTQQILLLGEHLKFLLLLPPAATKPQCGSGICIHGEVEITQVTVGPVSTNYGVGCLLCTYRVLPRFDLLAVEELVDTIRRSDSF